MKQLFLYFRSHLFRLAMAFCVCAAALLFCSSAFCTEPDDLLDPLVTSESEVNRERLLEVIKTLEQHKISLNDADADELRQLPWLTASDVRAILAYRHAKGTIHSLQELEPVLGKAKTALIAPCVHCRTRRVVRSVTKREPVKTEGSLYSRILWETTPRKGILNGKYAGENYKMYHRAELSMPHFNASLVQEKDIGEADKADFTSLSISVSGLGVLDRAVVGSYKLNFAQGLLVGQGRYSSKGADPVGGVRLFSKSVLPYTSSGEYGFLLQRH